jgi:hypothetical protein
MGAREETVVDGSEDVARGGTRLRLLLHRLVSAPRQDRELLRRIARQMKELWRPLRYLADLRSVWPELTEDQRREIEASIPYRNRFHERRVRACVDQLLPLVRQIQSYKHRELRNDMLDFLKSWDRYEPDQVQIFLALIRERV